MAARQGIRLRALAKNRKSKYKVKYTYAQVLRTYKGKTYKYTYRKATISKNKKYSYKKG